MKTTQLFFLMLSIYLTSCKVKEQEMPIPETVKADFTYNIDTVISKYNYNDMFFFNENTGVAVGSEGRIIKTTNAGLTWTIVNSGTIQNIRSIEFVNENIGWAGTAGALLKTVDGGNTWEVINRPDSIAANRIIYSVSFRNANNGIAVCQGGGTGGKFVLATTDGGITWKGKTIPKVTGLASVTDLRRVAWYNDTTAYGVGSNGTIIKTIDKGNSWTRVNTLNLEAGTRRYNNLFFINDIGYAAGQNGMLLKIEPLQNDSISLYPFYSVDDGQNDAWFTDANNGYVTGQYGELHKTTDGGILWSMTNLGSVAVTLRTVQVFPSGKVYVMGNGVFLKSN
jgi:photosystem II stability/assembly factor-like uncharacterized protein